MGTRLTLKNGNTLVRQDPKTKKKIEIKLTTEQIKELGLRTVKLRPDVGDMWYFIHIDKGVVPGIWEDNQLNRRSWDAGNGFFTEAEADKEYKRRKAERLIKDYKLEFDDMELGESQYKYNPIYNSKTNNIGVISWRHDYIASIYFSHDKFITDSEKISGGKITKDVWLDYLGVSDERN